MFFINGSYVQEAEAKISVLDLSILRGFGVFDYLRTYEGRPFHLWDHLLRLKYSAEKIGLELPYTLEEIAEIVGQVLERSSYPEASIKILATGGVSPDQFMPQNPATLIVFAYPLLPQLPELYQEGIKVITTPLSRSLPSCKTTQYIPGIVALSQGRKVNAFEALYVNGQGEILEATTSNFFGVKGGRLYTCMSEEVIAGITREVVLKLVKDHIEVCFEPIQVDAIGQLDEAFITSSNKEVMPVTQIDEIPIDRASCEAQGKAQSQVGPITRQIIDLFRGYTLQPSWPSLQIPRYALPALKE